MSTPTRGNWHRSSRQSSYKDNTMESSGTADLEGAVLDDDVVSSVRKPLLEEPAGEAPPNPWLARIIILLWLCMTPLAIYYRKEITEFVRYVASRGAEQGSLFYLYYVIVFVCTVACCVSLEIMIISSGFVFSHIHGPLYGVLIGTALSFIAYFITMFLCFLLSRHLLKGVVHRYLRHYKYYGALIKATEREGFSLVAMIRLSPFFPPTIVSYIFGSTNVGTRDYCLATFAAIPSIGFFTYLGSLIEDLSDDANPPKSTLEICIFIGVSTVVTLAGVYYTYVITKRHLEPNRISRRESDVESPET